MAVGFSSTHSTVRDLLDADMLMLVLQYPTAVAHHLYKLGLVHGHAKISFTLLSMGLPDGIRKIVENYLSFGKTFQIEGHDF